MLHIQVRGSFAKTNEFLARMKRQDHLKVLNKYGALGVSALSGATPVDEGQTAEGWYYEIESKPGKYAINWYNSNLEDPGRIPVAILIQYGHATGTGGIVQGVDYINPALHPIFDQMASDMWKEVTR